MKHFFATLLLATPLSSFADTIAVKQAEIVGPVTFSSPYIISEKNQKGQTFNQQEFFNNNISLLQEKSMSTIDRGAALTAEAPTMRVLRFKLRTDRFISARLNIRSLAYYTTYVNGQEANSSLRLKPGDTTIELLCLTNKTDKDSFFVQIEGRDLTGLQIHAPGKHLWSQEDMLFGPHYWGVSVSPNGRYISYSIYNTRKDGSAAYKTYIKEAKTHKIIRQYNDFVATRWIPTTDKLYTTRKDEKGNTNLFSINLETSEETLIAANIPEGDFTLSPTMDYLIYDKEQKGSTDLEGTKRIIDPDDRIPGWRDRSDLFMYNLKTKQMQRLTFGDRSIHLYDISSDGKKILFAWNKMTPSKTPFDAITILEMDAHTLKVDTLLCEQPFISSASYSPDGQQLLVKASPWSFNKIGCEVKPNQIPNSFDYRLYLYDIASKKVTPLLRNFKPNVKNYEWLKGDGKIYFNAEDGFNISLFSLNPKTLKVERLNLPITNIQQYSIAENSSKPLLLVTGQSGEIARQMFLGVAGQKMNTFGEINFEKEMNDVALPKCIDWNFKASRGDTIHNFYYLPANFDTSKKYPMIVYYYGGCSPTSKNLEGFWPLSALTSQGYIVLILEPSGATGFGQEFAARHVNTWGDESSDDIIEGVKRFCSEHSFINPKKIGCMGASYGGFMTQYLQTKTNLFAAAISHAGISDITAYWGGGYWGYTYGETAEYGNFPWSNPDLFVKHSPLYNADKIHTPLLLLHGTDDTNVPTNQSQALYTALRILNRPTAYITFDGENHVISKFKNRMAWQEIINAWFAMWLKDEPQWWNSLYPGDCFDKN